VGPAPLAPPAGVVVPAGGDEVGVPAVGDRAGVDQEGRHVHLVRGPLVVQGPGLGVGAHGERAAGDEHLAGHGHPGRRRRVRLQHRRAGPQLVGGQHRLVVLLLVLDDHAEGEPVGQQRPALVQPDPVQHVQRLVPDLADVRAGLGRIQQGQGGAVAAGVLEGVVELVDVAAYRVAAADVADQPQLLLVADVGQVPDQR
jgi:hypothetical protein